MARHRKKTRTHAKLTEEEFSKIPRSMVLSLGGDTLKNHSIIQLVNDMRNVMQPHTAINLKERKSNKLKDFVVMAGPLGVSHLLIFSQSIKTGNVNLKIARLPHGPTITFKVNNYSLCKDIRKFLKNPKSNDKGSKDYLNPPVLVLNGFTSPSKAEPHEKLLITILQSMFPAIQPQTMKVSGIKRVLILNKNPNGEIDLRHYNIDTKPVELTKSIKKLVTVKQKSNKKIPNLNKVKDVADFILDPYANGAGFTSESEIEDDEIVQINENNVHLKKKKTTDEVEEAKINELEAEIASQIKNDSSITHTKKRAIKLTEIGPRLSLSLVKIEDEVCSGKVIYHSLINKSPKEIEKLEKRHKLREKLKAERKKIQQDNVKAKQEKKEAKKLRRQQKKAEREAGEEVSSDEESESESESDGDGDVEMDVNDDDDDKLFSDEE